MLEQQLMANYQNTCNFDELTMGNDNGFEGYDEYPENDDEGYIAGNEEQLEGYQGYQEF